MATAGTYSDIEKGTDETFDILCSVCKGKNKNTEADKFCFECDDYYCSSCVKCHNNTRALKYHQIVDTAQFQVGSTIQLPAVPIETCKVHKDKPVDMYCSNHDVLECSACMLVKHSACTDKFYVQDYIKHSTNDTTSKDTEKRLDNLAKCLDELQKVFIKEKEELKDKKDKSLKEIRQFRKKIDQLLDRFEKNTVKELEQRIQSLTDKIDSELADLQALTTEIKAARDSLKSVNDNLQQMLVSINQASSIKQAIKQARGINQASSIKQAINQIVTNGEEKIRTTKCKVPPAIFFEANDKVKSLFSVIKDLGSIRIIKQLKITGSRSYPVKLKSDSTTCYIISACRLNDGTVILADFNNSKLKQLDNLSYTVTNCCYVPDRPWQVCAIDYQQVAVCCNSRTLIQFVNVGRKMKKTRQIKTGFECRGLAYAVGMLFVSGEKSVFMYSVSGDKLKQFSQDLCGPGMFSYINGLAVSSDNTAIYVADSRNGLIILDMKGRLVGQYNGDKLRAAQGVCLDNNDNVLVCGFTSKNVIQLSPYGQLIGEVLKTDGQGLPVSCYKKDKKMIVGFSDKDEIEVYQISAE